MMRARFLLGCSAVLLGLMGSQADASPVYLTGPDPWGNTTNDTAMNAAFGLGNWVKMNYATAVAGGIFTPGAHNFIFMDGGDGTEANFKAFLGANLGALQTWVGAGGALLQLAATWTTADSFGVGFGATSTHNNYDSGAPTGSATGPHPIFDGSTGTSWTGSYFSHNYITGGGLTSLIKDGLGRDILVERTWGSGYVMLGGLTTTNWHAPGAAAVNLRVNMLEYAAAQGGNAEIPEPASLVLFALGGLGCAGAARRRKLQNAV